MPQENYGQFHGRAIHGNRLVYVVDRDHGHLQYITQLLRRLGYRVDALSTEDDVRRAISRKLPDLIIPHFPVVGEDELTFLHTLRRDRRTAAVPVIAITASADLAGEKRCFDAGAANCLADPVDAEELYYAIQKALERRPRRNIRIPIRMPVYVNEGPLDCGAAGCDAILSARGMYVMTRRASPEREHLIVRFTLGGRPVKVHAHVLFSDYPGQALGRESGMGIYFTEIAPEDEAYIREYISHSIMAGTSHAPETEPRH